MVAKKGDMSADSSPSRQVTVVDVYDLASSIGKDFERIIDHFGADSVTNLMPKVISALELLETFAGRNERENGEIADLQSAVQRLEADKEQKQECRKKFDKELEQIEDNYRNEIKQLWDMVQRLQDENKRLTLVMEQKDQTSPMLAIKEDDLTMMLSLQETVDHQRDHMKLVDRESRAKQLELDKVQQQLEKLQRVNKELLRKNKAIQSQGRELVEEKADLISLLQERDHEIEHLKLQLGETEKARKDLEQSKLEEESERDNVPRFTLAELREVLQEKNYLKARVMELEEELAQLRPPAAPSPLPAEPKPEEDDVVYGPINKEPDEKLYPWRFGRKDSGVRKFFSRIWSSKASSRDRADSNASSSRSRWKNRRSTAPERVCTPSSASSSRTAAVPIVRYRNVMESPSLRLSLRRPLESDTLSVGRSLPNSSMSFSSFASSELDASQDFDGACVAEEFGDGR